MRREAVSASNPAEGTSSFISQFSVEPTGQPGRYRAEISSDWGAPLFPNGGVVSAIAASAMALELDVPAHTLRTLTTIFASKVANGVVEIDVEVLRRGKRMSQLGASVRNMGDAEPGHRLIASFGEPRPGIEIISDAPPEVPEPMDCDLAPPTQHAMAAFHKGFFGRLDVRRVRYFQSFEEDWEAGTAEAIRWSRYSETRGAPDEFGLLPLADTMPPAIGQYLGPGHRFFHAPSVDLYFQSIAAPESEWILTRSRIRWGGDGYASAEMHLWDEARRLVAYSTQMMLIRFPAPDEFK